MVRAISRPLLTRPTTCPARPTRWSPRATPRRASRPGRPGRPPPCRSPAPARPSRSTAGQLAILQGLLGFDRRWSWLRLPWCDRATDLNGSASGSAAGGRSASASSLRWDGQPLERSRRLLAKTIVERCDADQAEEPRLDRRPDRALGPGPGPVERGDHLQVQLLPPARVDDRHRPGLESVLLPSDLAASAQESRNFLQRPLRRRQTDADDPPGADRFEPFEQEREEDASLVRAEGMDLINDDVRQPGEHLPRLAGEHQVEGFGGRDQDVGRVAEDALPLVARRISGADRHRQGAKGRSRRLGRLQDPVQRKPEVAEDVVVQRFERRDIKDADARPLARHPPQMVQAGEERRERLARPGRREQERMLSGRDGRPAQPLRRRRLAKRPAKPGRDRRQETVQAIGLGHRRKSIPGLGEAPGRLSFLPSRGTRYKGE